ncbi:hypothetical protein [Allorhodopirellula solitaria]|uniref:DUF3618 domain-containing protein n=1 Tax=Allorhodopirellula solitaria TaxID=2527987 RepID=A0A5C5XTX8_9BACT|nr:hypothetical protein [Allorhodopirellula solitaria]TWT65032.1 hypothetical protein CA85_33770 [Allorhodopirellula solitaria]
MPSSVTTATRKQSEAIRSRMREIRSDLPYDVDDARARVKQLSDWKYHVSQRPFAVAAAAAVVGYLIVPAKQSSASTVVVQQDRAGAIDTPSEKGMFAGIAGTLVTLLARQALRVATNQVVGAMSARSGASPSPSQPEVHSS